MKKVLIALALVTLVFSSPKPVLARSGCCSHHGGVCGCGCCDGTGLSDTCAPYYPECSQPVYVAPIATITHATPKPATPKPTIRPTDTPEPTLTPTPTPTSVPEVQGASVEASPSPTPTTSGSNTFGYGVLAVVVAGIVYIYKRVNKKEVSQLPENEN